MSSSGPDETRAVSPRFLSTPRFWALTAAVIAGGSLATALWLQHHGGLLPCAWCVLQRLQTIVIIVAAVLALFLPGFPGRAVSALGALIALTGLATALYQHFVAASEASCDLTLADKIIASLGLDARWPSVFEAQAMCDEANLPWMGVPFALWAALMFVLTFIALVLASRRRSH